MPEKPVWKPLTPEQREDLRQLVSPPGWRTMPGRDLPQSIFPDSWRRKIGSALVVSDLTSTGGTYLYVGANRLDHPAGAIDIDPFGVIVHSSDSGPDGVFIYHGRWRGRTYRRRPPSGMRWSGAVSNAITELPLQQGRIMGPSMSYFRGTRGRSRRSPESSATTRTARCPRDADVAIVIALGIPTPAASI